MNHIQNQTSSSSWNMMKDTWLNGYQNKKITVSKLVILILKHTTITGDILITLENIGITKHTIENITYAYDKLDDSYINDNHFIKENDAILQEFIKYFINNNLEIQNNKIIIPTNIDTDIQYLDEDIIEIYKNITKSQNKVIEKFIQNQFKNAKSSLTKDQINILSTIDEKILTKFKNIAKTTLDEHGCISIDNLVVKDESLLDKLFALLIFIMHSELKYDNESGFLIENTAITFLEIINKLDDSFIYNDFDDISKNELLEFIPYAKNSIFSLLLKKQLYKEIKDDKYNIYLDSTMRFDEQVKDKHLNLSAIALKVYEVMCKNTQYKINFEDLAEEESKQNIKVERKTLEARLKDSFLPNYYKLLPISMFRYIRLSVHKKRVLKIRDLPFEDISLSKIIATFLTISSRRKYSFSNNFGLIYDEVFDGLVFDTKYLYKNIVKQVVLNTKDGTIFEYAELDKIIKSIDKNLNIENLKSKMIEQNDFVQIQSDPNRYILKDHFKSIQKKVELIYLLEENGYKKEKLNLAQIKLNHIFSKVYSNFEELSTEQISHALDQVQDIHFWGWGGHYIHKINIENRFKYLDLDDVVDFLHDALEDITQISLNKYFQMHEEYFKKHGIYNEYALHTLLKIRYNGEFQFNDSPWVARLDSKKRASLIDNILEVMDENRVFSLNELVQFTHQDELQLSFVLARTQEVVNFGMGFYIKKEFLKDIFSDEILEHIVRYIDENIDDDKLYYFAFLEQKFGSELHSLDIKYATHHDNYSKKHIVLDLLRKYKMDESSQKYKIIKNHRIVSKKYFQKTETLGYHHILKNHFFNNSDEVNIQDVDAFFAKRGFKDFMQSFVNVKDTQSVKNKLVVRKDKDTFVLIDSLGILNQEIEELNKTVKDYCKITTNLEGILERLLAENKLPQISQKWNKYMLYDFLNYEDFVKSPVLPTQLEVKSK